jgi:hypothetical protein
MSERNDEVDLADLRERVALCAAFSMRERDFILRAIRATQDWQHASHDFSRLLANVKRLAGE